MKNYILFFTLYFACPQLQAMELIESLIPDVPKGHVIQATLVVGAMGLGLAAGVVTDFVLLGNKDLTLVDFIDKDDASWRINLQLWRGTDPYRRVLYQDGSSTTAIHSAANNRNQLLELLLSQSGDVDIQDSNGQTPLHVAAIHDAAQCIQKLIAHGACLQATDNEGNSPLHLAVQNNAISSIEELLKLEAAVNVRDFSGNTPLHNAAITGNIAIITLLLRHGARADIRNSCQLSVWDSALENDHREAAEILLAAEDQRLLISQHVSPYGTNLVEKLIYREAGY